MKLPYWHIDAFADRPFNGNQAAVMPLDSWLEDDELLAIAEDNNFAETAFVVRDDSGEADWELRWFTPTEEVRLCGHATLASGHVLLTRDGGDRVTFRTREAGILEQTEFKATIDTDVLIERMIENRKAYVKRNEKKGKAEMEYLANKTFIQEKK